MKAPVVDGDGPSGEEGGLSHGASEVAARPNEATDESQGATRHEGHNTIHRPACRLCQARQVLGTRCYSLNRIGEVYTVILMKGLEMA